jgi:single-strand DNA-binding protein
MLNHIVLMGRITKDIDKKTTQSGVSVLTTTIAVDRDYKSGDEKQVDFVDCTFWRHNADFLEKYAAKGRMIVVSGRLESRKWKDKDGNNRVSWEVQAENVYLADSKRDGSNSHSANSYASNGAINVSADGFRELDDSDGGALPF